MNLKASWECNIIFHLRAAMFTWCGVHTGAHCVYLVLLNVRQDRRTCKGQIFWARFCHGPSTETKCLQATFSVFYTLANSAIQSSVRRPLGSGGFGRFWAMSLLQARLLLRFSTWGGWNQGHCLGGRHVEALCCLLEKSLGAGHHLLVLQPRRGPQQKRRGLLPRQELGEFAAQRGLELRGVPAGPQHPRQGPGGNDNAAKDRKPQATRFLNTIDCEPGFM